MSWIVGRKLIVLAIVVFTSALLRAEEPATTPRKIPRAVQAELSQLDLEAESACSQGEFARALAIRRRLQMLSLPYFRAGDPHIRALGAMQDSVRRAAELKSDQQAELATAHRDLQEASKLQDAQYTKAFGQFARAKATLENLLGKQDYYFLKASWGLVALALHERRLSGLEDAIRELLSGHEAIFGKNHPRLAELHGLHAIFLARSLRWEEAHEATARAETVRSQHDLPCDGGWCDLQLILCEILIARGKFHQARRAAEGVIAIASTDEKMLAYELQSYLVLGQCHAQNHRYRAAIEAIEHGVNNYLEYHFERSRELTLQSMRCAADAYRQLDRHEEALQIERDIDRRLLLLAGNKH